MEDVITIEPDENSCSICLDESIYAAISGDGNSDIMQEISLRLGQFSEIICMRTS